MLGRNQIEKTFLYQTVTVLMDENNRINQSPQTNKLFSGEQKVKKIVRFSMGTDFNSKVTPEIPGRKSAVSTRPFSGIKTRDRTARSIVWASQGQFADAVSSVTWFHVVLSHQS